MVESALLHWISNVPIGLVICITGIIGNAISIGIWLRILKQKVDCSPATSMYLICLGCVDCCILLLFLFIETIPALSPSVLYSYAYSFVYSYIGFPGFYFFVVSSIWLLVGVTVSRCIIVTVPLKSRFICNRKHTLLGIFAILSCSFIVNIPHFFNYSPKSANGTVVLSQTEYGKSNGSQNYEFWVHCLFLVLVPWAAITVMNSSIILSTKKQVHRSFHMFAKSEKQKCQQMKQQNRITTMLLAVTFAFLVLLGWQCATQCLWMTKYHFNQSKKWNVVDGNFAFAKLGVVINSSINWFLYCLSGSTFRKEFFKVICTSVKPFRRSSVSPLQTKTTASNEVTEISVSGQQTPKNGCHIQVTEA